MNVSKVKLNKAVIIAALHEHIDFLIERKNNSNKFTKFDSENDAFLGACGEYAFAKYLSEKGFTRGEDYFQINRYRKNIKFKEHFKEVNGILYDKYDFMLDIFTDQKCNKLDPFKIDIKTQKYVGKYTEDWQFAVNSNTVDQIKKEPNKIDSFLFIFSKDGLSDLVDTSIFNTNEKELENLKINLENHLKKKEIEVELLGMIEPVKFIALSEEFKEGEVFRMNNSSKGMSSFKAFSPMFRINLSYLSNIDKHIIPRNVNAKINIEQVNNYCKKLNINEDTKFVKISDGKNVFQFPFEKVYVNSQHKDFESFANSTLLDNKQKFQNRIKPKQGYSKR
jgi:hypothetical protein